MTSFKLIFRNVHKNIRDYLIYFLTLTFSVSLFYAFNSISDQPAFSDMGITGSLLYDQLGILLSAFSVVIAVVLAFLIIYANQFLLKRRKKELGVYMVLGMKKRRISRLFAGETLCVGWNYFFFFTIPIPISKALMRIPATRRRTYTLAFTLRSVVQVEKFAWRMVSCLVSYRR